MNWNQKTARFVVFCAVSVSAMAQAQVGASSWPMHAGNSQHTALSPVMSQEMTRIRWQRPVDHLPQYSGSSLLIHYGTPLVTPNNTMVMTVKTGATSDFQMEGRNAYNASLIWTQPTDYILPAHNWTPSVGSCLYLKNRLATPAAGGTILLRSNADSASATVTRVCFYGLANYNANKAAMDNNVFIVTPITSDKYGNLYFGYMANSNPLNLKGGVAKITPQGVVTYRDASVLTNNPVTLRPPYNCAPALSNNEAILYIALVGGNTPYLVAIDTATMTTLNKVIPQDPKIGGNCLIFDDGTSTPMVGPDGDVFYGAFESSFGYTHFRGYMYHFSSTLVQKNYVGAFGWDNTPSVVPASAVPSYNGGSPYLLMTKYNHYIGLGDGMNKMAVLDPFNSMMDPFDNTLVMNDVLTVLGPTPEPGGGVKEWCLNTGVVDPFKHAAVVNSEDGKCYCWDFNTNTLEDAITLTPGIGEAYTPTLIGPDGTAYAINNGTLFALGDNNILPDSYTAVSGMILPNSIEWIRYNDFNWLNATANPTIPVGVTSPCSLDLTFHSFDDLVAGGGGGGGNVGGIGNAPSFTVRVTARSRSASLTQRVLCWNYLSQMWIDAGSAATSAVNPNDTTSSLTFSNNASQYVGPGGEMKIRVQYYPANRIVINRWNVEINRAAIEVNPAKPN